MSVFWALPAIRVLASLVSGFYYGRHIFVLSRQQTLPDAPWSQMVFWFFNMPCLAVVNILGNPIPPTWQPQEYTRVWLTQPATLMVCAVVNTGVWSWIGAQWEDPGDRVSWWRWPLATIGATLGVRVLLHSRTADPPGDPVYRVAATCGVLGFGTGACCLGTAR